MTTAAFDGEYLAVDSQLTTGERKTLGKKLRRLASGSVAAGCGTVTDILAIYAWLEDEGDKPGSGEAEVMLLDPTTREAWRYILGDDGLSREVLEAPWAIGTGGDYAIGAMMAGADAKAAVEIAGRVDLNTGGKVLSYRFPKRRGRA